MESVKLDEWIGKSKVIEYPSQTYEGIITCDEIHGRPYYHLAFKSLVNKGVHRVSCIKTIFLREENLKYYNLDKNERLISEIDFCPIWTHYPMGSEYKKLEGELKK